MGSYFVFTCLYASLCVLMGPYWSLLVLIGPYPSLQIHLVLVRPYVYVRVLMGSL